MRELEEAQRGAAQQVLLDRFAKLEFNGEPPDFAPYTALRTLESFQLRATPA